MDAMDSVANVLSAVWWLLLLALVAIFYKTVLRLFGAVIIPGTAIGVVRKRWVLLGSNRTLPDGKIIALHGEAGFQADTLAPGLHWGFWPWQYDITVVPFIDIPEGKLGVVDAKDGAPLTKRVFGREVECNAFQDARAFLLKGGQRGPPDRRHPSRHLPGEHLDVHGEAGAGARDPGGEAGDGHHPGRRPAQDRRDRRPRGGRPQHVPGR
jgi:uncharacterized membrane protein YqiK